MHTVPPASNKSNPVQNSRIVVEKITLVHKGNLAAFATVLVGSTFRFFSLRIVHQPGKPAWVSLPQTEVPPKTPNDKRKFYPIVEILDKQLRDEIFAAVLAAYASQKETPQQGPIRANIPSGPFVATDEDILF